MTTYQTPPPPPVQRHVEQRAPHTLKVECRVMGEAYNGQVPCWILARVLPNGDVSDEWWYLPKSEARG